MIFVMQVLREQFSNLQLILRLAIYGIKSNYQQHYLGVLWQLINPFVRIVTYWLVFGLGIRGGSPVGTTPFFIWLITGLIPWIFISTTIVQASNSIYAKVHLVSKMKFPVSILPSVSIIANLGNLFVLLAILEFILFINGNNQILYLLQLPYYLLCMVVFIFALSILSATLTTMIRDLQNMLQSIIRILVYVTPILWDMSGLPEKVHTLLKLNPVYYLIEGMRKTFLGQGWFFQDLAYLFYFWCVTLLLLIVGATIHIKLRDRLVDYV